MFSKASVVTKKHINHVVRFTMRPILGCLGVCKIRCASLLPVSACLDVERTGR